MIARYNKAEKEKAYREYVCENLRIIGENTSKIGGGSYFKASLSDVLKQKPKVEDKTGEEIVADVVKRCGLKVVS